MRTSTIATAALLAASLAATRPAGAGELWLGAGGNFTRTTISDSSDDPGTAFGGGLLAEYAFNDQLSLVLQPSFLTHKTEGTVPASPGGYICITSGPFQFCGNIAGQAAYDYRVSASYIDAPILAKYSLRKQGVTPYLLAGPSLSFLASASYEARGDSEDIKDELNSLQLGLCGGLGLQVPLGKKARVFAEGQYALGLSGVHKDDDEPNRYRSIVVKAGLEFALTRGRN